MSPFSLRLEIFARAKSRNWSWGIVSSAACMISGHVRPRKRESVRTTAAVNCCCSVFVMSAHVPGPSRLPSVDT